MNEMLRTHRSTGKLAALFATCVAGVLFWLGAAHPIRASADIACVNQTGTGCDPACGAGCYALVQSAVNALPSGGQIRIAGGVYSDPTGTVASISKQLAMRGGYGQSCGDEVFDPEQHQTVLDAQGSGSVVSIINAGDVSLQHLVLTHGNGTGNYFPTLGCGGGIYALESNLHLISIELINNVGSEVGGGLGGGLCTRDSNIEIMSSRISGNSASVDPTNTSYANGGGIYLGSSLGTHSASLRENEILDNVGNVSDQGSGGGGGIYLYGITGVEMVDNIIQGNQATLSNTNSGSGGGLYISYCSDVVVAGNRIEHNVTHPNFAYLGQGGGIYIYGSDAHLTRNMILNNRTPDGGGIFIRSDQPVTVSNNLIARNDYSGITVIEYYSPFFSRAILVNNTIVDNGYNGVLAQSFAEVTLTNNLIAGHAVGLDIPAPFTGTVTADTNLFWNTDDPNIGVNAIRQDPGLIFNYHLASDSPALDAGLTIPWLEVDLEGNPRPQGYKYDIGAFEGAWWWQLFLPMAMRN
jgi:hypothetical protein